MYIAISIACVVLLLVASLFCLRAIHNWRLSRSWSRVAEELDLELDQSSIWDRPRLDGTLHAYPVEVEVDVDKGGHNDQKYTWYRLELLEPPSDLHMYSLTRLGHGEVEEPTGRHMIEEMDSTWTEAGEREEFDPPREAIDAQVWPIASDVSRARKILDDEALEEAVTSVFSSENDTDAALHEGTLYYRERGFATDAGEVRSTLSDLATLAETVERRGEEV